MEPREGEQRTGGPEDAERDRKAAELERRLARIERFVDTMREAIRSVDDAGTVPQGNGG